MSGEWKMSYKKNLLKITILASISILMIFPSNLVLGFTLGDETSTFVGNVRDQNGNMLSNAKVELLENNIVVETYTTSTNGLYTIMYIQSITCSYKLRATYDGSIQTKTVSNLPGLYVNDFIFDLSPPQQPGYTTINGYVKDKSGTSLAGVTVEIYNDATNAKLGEDITDKNGYYSKTIYLSSNVYIEIITTEFNDISRKFTAEPSSIYRKDLITKGYFTGDQGDIYHWTTFESGSIDMAFLGRVMKWASSYTTNLEIDANGFTTSGTSVEVWSNCVVDHTEMDWMEGSDIWATYHILQVSNIETKWRLKIPDGSYREVQYLEVENNEPCQTNAINKDIDLLLQLADAGLHAIIIFAKAFQTHPAFGCVADLIGMAGSALIERAGRAVYHEEDSSGDYRILRLWAKPKITTNTPYDEYDGEDGDRRSLSCASNIKLTLPPVHGTYELEVTYSFTFTDYGFVMGLRIPCGDYITVTHTEKIQFYY